MKVCFSVFATFALAATFCLPGMALALDQKVLDSVVRLKPDWSLAARGRDATGAPRDPEGTGVAVLPGGYIATNVHVIGDAEKIDVTINDGRRLPANIVGRDKMTDIALLKVDIDLPILAGVDVPPLAERVCAIGNQFGLGLSVTCGVVSARNRSGIGFNPIEDFVQTDASINPGGSGGALVDANGRLVGMVSAIFTKQSDADIGVNFATSMKLLMRVVEDLKAHGEVVRPRAGLSVQGWPSGVGIMTTKVDTDGPAFKAGLDAGDVILRINDRRIVTPAGFDAALFMRRPGDEITLETQRGDEKRTLTFTLSQ